MAKKPEVIHISGFDLSLDDHETKPYLCDNKREGWPDKYCTDEFASKLPVCPDCTKAYEELFGKPYARGI